MKRIIFGSAIILTAFTACNNSASNNSANAGDTAVVNGADQVAPAAASPVSGIITGYLHLKNALAADDAKGAATASNDILSAMKGIDMTGMEEQKHKVYMAVADDIKENAEHINANADKIDHQREHFEMLSKDVYDLIKAFGSGQTLYKDFCPMAAEGKGAFWISEMKDIKNPYFGSQMQECGEVQEEIK